MYAFDALSRATHEGSLTGWFAIDLAVVVAGTLIALALAALTLRRRTA